MSSSQRQQGGRRLPRSLHPIAWWIWAASLGVAASRTTNPLLLMMILAVLGYVVTARRTEAPWAKGFKYYLWFALVVIVIRVMFRSVFASGLTPHDHILLTLPRIPTPHWYAGVQLGGPVSLEATCRPPRRAAPGRPAVLSGRGQHAGQSQARAAGAARRAVRIGRGRHRLHQRGPAVGRERAAGGAGPEAASRPAKGFRALRSIAVPVLEDALDRSLKLAAAMDSRGYGRTGRRHPGPVDHRCADAARHARAVRQRLRIVRCERAQAAGPAQPGRRRAVVRGGLALGGRRISRTSYRPDPWRLPECLVAACGLASAALLFVSTEVRPARAEPVAVSAELAGPAADTDGGHPDRGAGRLRRPAAARRLGSGESRVGRAETRAAVPV